MYEYWQKGNFPINDKYSYRTPIFIDDYNNFCAVGYLMMATGHEDISRMVQAKTNLAYVREMNYPQLNEWANNYGFTTDELAWIQPGYGPIAGCGTESVGKGVNGEVTELYVNTAGDKLYVGGNFTEADSSVSVNNLAYVTESNGVYQWHDLGNGVNGTIYAIQEFQGNIFVGGSFTMAGNTPVTNVAYWDGSKWNSAGCIYGTIKDFEVYNNELYAAGDFDVCAAMSEVNIAKWNGSMWGQMPNLDGNVNTIKEHKGVLYIGGSFSWMNNVVNIIKWTEANGFETFINSSENEVMDIGIYKDSVYAICKRTSATDSNLLLQLDNAGNWKPFSGGMNDYLVMGGGANSFNTFCVQADTVLIGGDFYNYNMMGPVIENCFNLFEYPSGMGSKGNWFSVDDEINKMVIFKGSVIAGGKFDTGANWAIGGTQERLNYIAKKVSRKTTAVKDISQSALITYPNPISPNAMLSIENKIGGKKCILRNITGAKVLEYSSRTPITKMQIPQLTTGVYLLELSNDNNEKATGRLMVQ